MSELCPDALAIGGDPARQVVVPDGVHPRHPVDHPDRDGRGLAQDRRSHDGPNPLLDSPISQPENDSTTEHGIRSDNAPATLSKVVIHVQERDNHAVALHAGPVGVAQDDDFVWRPIVGWHLTRASIEMGDVID
ncbi:hypothetical protein [Kibdelosporangium aridum]|uniref:hypothetical protein n=1 Tax=Kibdelosporangium aridum TaxID=2030 RepID=UPI000A056FBC|nr:hypothetical protein [Kibdelosporangium aridum]